MRATRGWHRAKAVRARLDDISRDAVDTAAGAGRMGSASITASRDACVCRCADV